MRVIRARARLLVEPRHGLEVVVHHVRRRLAQDGERAVEPAAEVRHQHLDLRAGRMRAHRADAVDEVRSAAVAQVVAVDAGDHDVFEFQRGDRPREIERLVRVERQRPPMPDVAERAAARADVAHDHERRRALAEALADIRAGRLLAHRMQVVLAQDLLDLGKARGGRRAHADPVGLLQPLGGHDLDRDARSLGGALVLDARGIGGGRDCRGRVRDVHGQRCVRFVARIGASSAPADSGVRMTERSASCVTLRPG